MIINFRQGIVSYDTSIAPFTAAASVGGTDVSINVGTQPFVVAVANQSSNYLWSESLTINAWPSLSPAGTYWLYLDWNPTTFERTFGTSVVRPIAQATAPAVPAVGQHWYQTTTSQMFFWNGATWNPVIRLFVAKFIGPATFQSISINAPGSFQGTTVGDTTPNSSTGMVVFDSSGYPIFKHNGTFFTTEDQVFAEGSAITGVRLESNVFTAQSVSPSIIPVYTPVGFNTNGQIYVAGYNDCGVTAIGMTLQQINFAGSGAVLLEGTVTNPLWNFAGSVGGLLWVSGDIPGTFQTTDPHLDAPITYPIQRVPVARIISPTSIIFLQGIGTKGDPGPSGSTSVPLASATQPGTVYLSTDSGALPAPTPTVVSELDPRLSNARPPTPHNQSATTITTTAYTSLVSGVSFPGGLLQPDSLNGLADSTVALSGSTMTGLLVLSGDPVAALGAATKQYVDTTANAAVNTKVSKAGDTMTGLLVLSGDPTALLGAATKQYVDAVQTNLTNGLALKLSLTGGTMSGAIAMGSGPASSPITTNAVTNVTDPVNAQDAATKNYVDTITTLPNLVLPYDLAFFFAGGMTQNNSYVGAYLAPRAITIPAGAAGSLAKCVTAPLSNCTYTILQNGASIGTVFFPGGLTVGTVSIPALITLAIGDVLAIQTPNTIDPNIQNVYVTILGTAVA
jgi:3D (Asp-Asp-Asp) domain-containing protein